MKTKASPPCRTASAFIFAALLALATTTQHANAQCGPGLGGVPVIQLPNQSGVVHIGDTISILGVGVGNQINSLASSNIDVFILYPNGTTNHTGTQVRLGAGQLCGGSTTPANNACPSGPNSGDNSGTCLPFPTSYVVRTQDIARTLSFAITKGNLTTPFGPATGLPKTVQFMECAAGNALNANGTVFLGANAAAVQIVPVTVIFPCVTITKECVNPCTPYGQPIQFRGQVCNTGDTTLFGVQVFDTPSGGSTVLVTNVGDMSPGQCVNYSGSYTPANTGGASLCGPFTDTISATGTDITGQTIRNTDPCIDPTTFATTGPRPPVTATCHVSENPSITLTKDCQPRSILAGQSYSETFVVCNNGNVPLSGVVIHDTKKGVTTDITIGNLAIGQCVTNAQGPFSTSVADCPSITDRATATGNNICPPDATCPSAPTVSSSEVTCTVNILCPPGIQVQKEVVCQTPGVACENATGYAKVATGVRGADDPNCPNDNGCPAFCYRITVTNTGAVDLVSVTLTDNNGTPGSTGDDVLFTVGNLAVGASQTRFYSATRCTDTHNIVVAQGQSAVDSSAAGLVRATNSADVVVVPIGVNCSIVLSATFDMDGDTNNNSLTLPQGFTGDIADGFHISICNTGQAPVNASATLTIVGGLGVANCTDTAGNPVDMSNLGQIDPGQCKVVICDLTNVTCQNASITAHVVGTAVATAQFPCIYNVCGHAITSAESTCPATIVCTVPTTCRVTGGGQLIPDFTDQSCIQVNTTIFPATSPSGMVVRSITHGGELGAPFSQMDCGAILGNPCIRGQWSHVRHYEGASNPRDVIDMDFHSTTPKGVYDSLSCACLGCCDPATGAFIPASQGPLIKKFQICNPDDHKVCGPQPRPSPANSIIWSGVGTITPEDDVKGSRSAAAEWVVFRIYIEDRSEPGGGKSGGAVEPADIYCFQAWKTGIKVSKKPDFTTIATGFRAALGQANCDFLNSLESGALPIGSLPSPTVQGQTADIQDCGPLYTGNHQIHPATGATCN